LVDIIGYHLDCGCTGIAEIAMSDGEKIVLVDLSCLSEPMEN
jgi:hypothetical protein